ncbi:MAG: hypothetical protein LBI42_09130 [Chitinispirillales bacterium]|jgi:hypothetical protein|nr:hypothetical protein [Chitinispirillales bacterium]
MQQYDWYADIPANMSLEQGDIIEKCNIIEQNYDAILNGDESEMNVITIDAIVLSQSCDIENDKIDSIILCPILSLRNLPFIDPVKEKEARRQREALRQGTNIAYHLLNKIEIKALPEDYYVVSFRHIYSVPKKFIEKTFKNSVRKRLLPPYREHLSQSFARYFMRVGLPSNISAAEIKEYGK